MRRVHEVLVGGCVGCGIAGGRGGSGGADAPGRGEPGTGGIDFAPLFRLIDERGYGGWVSAEYRPSKPTPETLGFL